jgi:hypothetical protein
VEETGVEETSAAVAISAAASERLCA